MSFGQFKGINEQQLVPLANDYCANEEMLLRKSIKKYELVSKFSNNIYVQNVNMIMQCSVL